MVNSPPSFAPPIRLDSAATELKALFEETRPLDLPLPGVIHAGLPLPDGSTLASQDISQDISLGISQNASQTVEGNTIGRSSLLRSVFGGVLSVGAIGLTIIGGGLSGAMVAQQYPSLSEGELGTRLMAGVDSPPVLEQFFQLLDPQRLRLSAPSYPWLNRSLPVEPSRLEQWQPGELEAEIDRLLAASQTLETDVGKLEQQLGLQSQNASQPSLSQRLLALRQSVDSPSGATLPLQMTLPADLLFEDGKTSLKPEAQDLLDNLEKSLRSELNLPQGVRLNLTIATHTDNVGNAAQNLDLSLQRSRSLQGYLSQRLNSSALAWMPVGYGSNRPLADNSTESNRQRNRRVEITLDW